MIIHQPEMLKRDGHTILFSKIEMRHPPVNFPEYLWYRVPDSYSQYFSFQSDAFLVPGLLAGMYFKEDIKVRGTVSPKLAYHLDEYQQLLHFILPEDVTPVEIKYDQLKPLQAKPSGVGTTFSGGVDSFFTIWKHLPQNQPNPDYQITHGVFIKGFDILPSDDQLYKFLFEKYNWEGGKIGITLIPLETNLVSITHQRLPLPHFYGPIIAAAGIVFAGGFQRFFIPSSCDYQKTRVTSYTSNPILDRLLSTDTLDIIHHGSTYLRVEKVRDISDWEIAQRLLRVCENHQFEKDTWNCSRCEKCLRTMIPIYALGKMGKFKTFKKPLLSNRDGLWWARKYTTERVFSGEIFPFVKEYKPRWLPWLWSAAALGVIRYWLFIKLLPGFIKKWLRRYGYFIDHNEAPDAYEIPEITQLIRENHDHSST
jgi:hypothetical protein